MDFVICFDSDIIIYNFDFNFDFQTQLQFLRVSLIISRKLVIMQSILAFLLMVFFSAGLRLESNFQINQTNFQTLTNLNFDSSIGIFTSHKNALVCFFIQDQNNQETMIKSRKEFESVRNVYLKTKQITQPITSDKSTSVEENISEDQIQNQESSKVYHIEFFVVKCLNQDKKSEKQSICQALGVNEGKQIGLFFFSNKSEIIQFNDQMYQPKIINFLNKIKDNSNYGQNLIKFDLELSTMAKVFQQSNNSIKQKALRYFKVIKSYLTYDLLLFLLVFIVGPFSYGYVSTKLQERSNRKRLHKYASNQQPLESSSKIKNQKEKEKSS